MNSLIEASIKFNFKLNTDAQKYRPNVKFIKYNKNKISIFDDPKNAVKGADVVLSDKVISMNDKVNKK